MVTGAELVGGTAEVLGTGLGADVVTGFFGVVVELELPEPAAKAVLLVTVPGRLLVVVERRPDNR